ncbi:sensor histidine kinase [Dactylosporangium matsuzakiense]|uniref:sensor histidine kinase n=1 Tax=Dactylosporangium matsuzakiense TaxID=53360 RepID=UPI0022040309|nr:sensor histidine kinase [Dactylosporangium matsuzakiense]
MLVAVLLVSLALAAAAAATFGALLARARRRHRRALGEQGWLLERERQSAATGAVAAERARIARELHDIVSHNVSVMVVQAAAAREVLAVAVESVPPDVAEALSAVEAAGRDALKELRHLLGLLAPTADGADPADPEDFAPQPGLDALSRLVDRIAFAGLPVDVRITGEPRPLPAGIDVTAYRIVQEALTNALKHAQAAQAEVAVRYTDRSLRIEVLNTPRPGPPSRPTTTSGSGRGLLGLRQRVTVYGGDFNASRRFGGGFRVRARIPLDPP